MKIFKTKMILTVVTTMIFVGALSGLQSCSNENDIENNNDVANLKAEYGLKKIKSNKNNVVEFNTIDEAEAYLEKIKHRKKHKGEMSLNLNSSSLGEFSATFKSKHYNSIRQKVSSNEQKGWETTTDAGLFSDFILQFNTGIDDKNIDPSSISLSTEGARVGWAYSTNGVPTMVDADSFIINGTISWGVGVSGATLGYDESVEIRIDIDWSTGKVTWTEL